MKKYGRVDSNQKEIVNAARKIGASVAVISSLGDGIPDAIMGFRGVNYLIEIKDGDKPPSQRKLTADEQKWHNNWKGTVNIINSVDEILDLLTKK